MGYEWRNMTVCGIVLILCNENKTENHKNKHFKLFELLMCFCARAKQNIR